MRARMIPHMLPGAARSTGRGGGIRTHDLLYPKYPKILCFQGLVVMILRTGALATTSHDSWPGRHDSHGGRATVVEMRLKSRLPKRTRPALLPAKFGRHLAAVPW